MFVSVAYRKKNSNGENKYFLYNVGSRFIFTLNNISIKWHSSKTDISHRIAFNDFPFVFQQISGFYFYRYLLINTIVSKAIDLKERKKSKHRFQLWPMNIHSFDGFHCHSPAKINENKNRNEKINKIENISSLSLMRLQENQNLRLRTINCDQTWKRVHTLIHANIRWWFGFFFLFSFFFSHLVFLYPSSLKARERKKKTSSMKCFALNVQFLFLELVRSFLLIIFVYSFFVFFFSLLTLHLYEERNGIWTKTIILIDKHFSFDFHLWRTISYQ